MLAAGNQRGHGQLHEGQEEKLLEFVT